MALTKKDIAQILQQQNGCTKNYSYEPVDTVLELIKSSLENGDDVLISGFGKFCVKEKNKRRGRNPATGDDMMLRARRVVTFTWSRTLRDQVNGQ